MYILSFSTVIKCSSRNRFNTRENVSGVKPSRAAIMAFLAGRSKLTGEFPDGQSSSRYLSVVTQIDGSLVNIFEGQTAA